MELRFRPRARTTKDLDLACASDLAGAPTSSRLAVVRERLQEAAARDLGDFLAFRIGEAARVIEAAPEGGARFPVVVLLAGREYGRFHVDVGLGTPPPGRPERLMGDDLLAFAGLPPAVALAVPRETQFAEKVHAFTRPWDDRINTRTKDLVDLLLLVEAGLPDRGALVAALREAFGSVGSHALPAALPAAPFSRLLPPLAMMTLLSSLPVPARCSRADGIDCGANGGSIRKPTNYRMPPTAGMGLAVTGHRHDADRCKGNHGQ